MRLFLFLLLLSYPASKGQHTWCLPTFVLTNLWEWLYRRRITTPRTPGKYGVDYLSTTTGCLQQEQRQNHVKQIYSEVRHQPVCKSQCLLSRHYAACKNCSVYSTHVFHMQRMLPLYISYTRALENKTKKSLEGTGRDKYPFFPFKNIMLYFRQTIWWGQAV